jgi:hypothetical protein
MKTDDSRGRVMLSSALFEVTVDTDAVHMFICAVL